MAAGVVQWSTIYRHQMIRPISECPYRRVSSYIPVNSFWYSWRMNVGRDSSVGIAIRYGLDGPGSNPGGGEIFRPRPDRPCGPSSLLYNGCRVSFPGVKRPGRRVDNPFHLAPKSRAVPLLPFWDSVACFRVNFSFILIKYSCDWLPASFPLFISLS